MAEGNHLQAIFASDGAVSHASGLSVTLGANLGANSSGRLWTCVDGCGLGGLLFLAVWTAVDACGHLGDLRIRRLFVDCVASERRAIPRCHRDPAARRRVQELLPGVED